MARYADIMPCIVASALLIGAIAGNAVAGQEDLAALLEQHAVYKQEVLEQLRQIPQLALMRQFATTFTEVWRHILMDGPYNGVDQQTFVRRAMRTGHDASPLDKALASLVKSHEKLFGTGRNAGLMVRHASDPAFKPFGRCMTLAGAMAEMTAGNGDEIQAFQTVFETGRNTRGCVHKLECHGQAVEFIYAATDIVYGVMLPTDLEFGADRVAADPTRVRLFYVRSGEVIALHPYVLHSGSLSVEPDRSFAILIYKKPARESDQVVDLPQAWQQRQGWIRIPNADKFYLTLAELHTDNLKDNRGFIIGAKPVRLPGWK